MAFGNVSIDPLNPIWTVTDVATGTDFMGGGVQCPLPLVYAGTTLWSYFMRGDFSNPYILYRSSWNGSAWSAQQLWYDSTPDGGTIENIQLVKEALVANLGFYSMLVSHRDHLLFMTGRRSALLPAVAISATEYVTLNPMTMKRLILLLVGFPILAQTGAVFTQFTPTSWGIAIGPTHCYAWSKLAKPWVTEIACYDSGGLQQVSAQTAGKTMAGHFTSTDGDFTWIFSPSASTPGAVDYQITAGPAVGASLLETGTF